MNSIQLFKRGANLNVFSAQERASAIGRYSYKGDILTDGGRSN
jgi:hypothetical protein